jgi:hypothetical protein
VQQLLRRPLVVLPEKVVTSGDEWTTTSDLQTAAGAFKQQTTYRLKGTAEQGGKTVQRIEMSSKIDPQVKEQKHNGTILFSADEGRVVEAEQTQRLVTERPYRETAIVVTLSSTQKTTVKPTE